MTEEKVGGAVDVKVNALLCLIVTLLTEDTFTYIKDTVGSHLKPV